MMKNSNLNLKIITERTRETRPKTRKLGETKPKIPRSFPNVKKKNHNTKG
jgi:hypothetical protein